jgi:uncharacterized protein (DUF2141 family)
MKKGILEMIMNNILLKIIFLICFLNFLMPYNVYAETANSVSIEHSKALITFKVIFSELTKDQKKAIQEERSQLLCALFDNEQGFPDDPFKARERTKGIQENNVFSCVFKNIEPGEYAVIFVFDENMNETLDRNFFGIPKESWGVTQKMYRRLYRKPEYRDSIITVESDTKNDSKSDEIIKYSAVLQ